MIGRLPLDEQLGALRQVLSRNDVLMEVLARAATLDLPRWYLTAGCLFQTVWNVVTGRPPADGIKDYDVFYFDDADLSWEAEDAVIRAGKAAFAGMPAEVEIRNEARVHLWYEEKFGVPCPPYGPPRRRSTASPRRRAVWVYVSSQTAVACLRAARAVRRVQPRRPAEPGPCSAGRL